MTRNHKPKHSQTEETKQIEQAFHAAGFRKVDAYRYNSASIRVRVIDQRFQGMSWLKRLDWADEIIHTLPESLQTEIVFVALLTPAEVKDSTMNQEFESPSPVIA